MKQFKCCFCGQAVSSLFIHQRNHCPFCLWSKHIDEKPGDRKSTCHSCMEPIGLTFKDEGLDKYGKARQGEIMLIHQCTKCSKISINRIAADDDPQKILAILEKSAKLDQEIVETLKQTGILVINQNQLKQVEIALFGEK